MRARSRAVDGKVPLGAIFPFAPTSPLEFCLIAANVPWLESKLSVALLPENAIAPHVFATQTRRIERVDLRPESRRPLPLQRNLARVKKGQPVKTEYIRLPDRPARGH